MFKNIINKINPKLVLLCLAVYIFTAYSWWTILHFRNNKTYFENNREIIKLRNTNLTLGEIEKIEAFIELEKNYERKNFMILGEALVFFSILLFGTNWIYNKLSKEEAFNLQQQNFLHSITHELKSPLAGVKLGIDTILKRNLEGEKKERLLKMSATEVSRLNSLIDNVLLSAKLGGNALVPNFQIYNSIGLLQPIVERLNLVHSERNIKLNCEDFQLKTDNWMIESIMVNLIENAIKYSPKNEPIEIICKLKKEKIEIAVKDYGNGISKEDKKEIFKKFYRIGDEMTRTAKGTGLGLFIVNELIKSLKGKITVSNNQPKGTIFNIFLQN